MTGVLSEAQVGAGKRMSAIAEAVAALAEGLVRAAGRGIPPCR